MKHNGAHHKRDKRGSTASALDMFMRESVEINSGRKAKPGGRPRKCSLTAKARPPGLSGHSAFEVVED